MIKGTGWKRTLEKDAALPINTDNELLLNGYNGFGNSVNINNNSGENFGYNSVIPLSLISRNVYPSVLI